MKEEEIFDRLCIRDKRNPMFQDIYGDCEANELPEPRGEDCYCYACFYGRDGLALEILKGREMLEELLKACKALLSSEMCERELPSALLPEAERITHMARQAIAQAEGK